MSKLVSQYFHQQRHSIVMASKQQPQNQISNSQYDYKFLHGLRGVQDKSVGALLGCMCGDTMGRAVEGSSRPMSYSEVEERQKQRRMFYTDDTEMTYALAKSLVRTGFSDPQDTTNAYTEEFHVRGYSRGTEMLMKMLIRKEITYETSGVHHFEEGSFANGGAMRIAPLAIAYRNAQADKLLEGVKNALYCTHRHPLGIDGAFAQALAIRFLVQNGKEMKRQSESESERVSIKPTEVIQYVFENVESDEMKSKLEVIKRSLEELQQQDNVSDITTEQSWEGIDTDPRWQFDVKVLEQITASFQIKATDAAASSIYVLCRHFQDPLNA
eukprot:TRINITY_DN17275_c1_g1_i3.p3 TRINITY_DN17275_c1_g1~~TRINITY_DN17275_c1_g1_i3.p3  ORF type:complete len:327 (-),score=38.35 TRINITY_DN17275_c1_g1_i3:490-1470(-)